MLKESLPNLASGTSWPNLNLMNLQGLFESLIPVKMADFLLGKEKKDDLKKTPIPSKHSAR